MTEGQAHIIIGLLQDIKIALTPGEIDWVPYTVTKNQVLNRRFNSLMFYNAGNTPVLLNGVIPLPVGATLPMGAHNDLNSNHLQWNVRFDETGVGSPNNLLVILEGKYQTCV